MTNTVEQQKNSGEAESQPQIKYDWNFSKREIIPPLPQRSQRFRKFLVFVSHSLRLRRWIGR